MNQNHWHGRREGCKPGACRYGCPQCPECGSCRSTTDAPGAGHDDGCTGAQAEIDWLREFLSTRQRKVPHIKRPKGDGLPICVTAPDTTEGK